MLVPRMSPGPTVVLLFIVDCAQGDRARVTFPESTYLYISTRQNEEPGVRQLFALVLLAGLYVSCVVVWVHCTKPDANRKRSRSQTGVHHPQKVGKLEKIVFFQGLRFRMIQQNHINFRGDGKPKSKLSRNKLQSRVCYYNISSPRTDR